MLIALTFYSMLLDMMCNTNKAPGIDFHQQISLIASCNTLQLYAGDGHFTDKSMANKQDINGFDCRYSVVF